ncbi:hypothetical protein C2G38_2230216 [Gigaspora rosea]|uniref:Uncharacterized protein n=1 Tax=Gigaspora rosea TaxID=44941 RepID=A0A397U2I8_9GLOM|nr:hypothetical protein C2G38_2230216 [Gigaspora rosea]
MLSNIKYFFKKHCQNESNNDSQNPENRIDSSKYSTSDESISEFDKKRKKAKVKKSVGRPEDPVNKEYIKLGVRDKHGHVAMKSADIIKKTFFGSQVLSKCQEFVTYFQNSHMPGAQLRDEIKNFLIKGRGLKLSIKTRWCSAWDCCDSVLKLEAVLQNISSFEALELMFRYLILINK